MSIDLNDEIVQDFLVEAGEILELLGEQLVDLEGQPENAELLNAVFRGFHTVKGGAGFIGVGAVVDVCHKAEDTFNLLRQGQRDVEAALMDTMLKVLDVLNVMFDHMRAGEDPVHADVELMAALDKWAQPPDDASDGCAAPPPPAEQFEDLLDSVNETPGNLPDTATAKSTQHTSATSDEITDDEFEAMLDELHGAQAPAADAKPASAAAENSEISEDDFEALLDDLHGAGRGPSAEHGEAVQTEGEVVAEVTAGPTLVEPPPVAGTTPLSSATVVPKKPPPESTVRVDTDVLNRIMNMVGELVLVRNRFSTLDSVHENEDIANAVSNLDVVTTDLQAAAMRTRMQPIKKVFGRFPRVVRDLARTLGKEIDLVTFGEETELDKNLVDALADPMVHLVRNAVDHGLEDPKVRANAGKSKKGTVTLAAEQQGDQILLRVSDDGAGMDADRLRHKAVENGVMDSAAAGRLSDTECFNLIFAPGFSTKQEISDVSGRGVGMDVVKSRISELNGTVEIDSVLGKGTQLTIKIPLTLAIVPTLMVKLENQVFALPLMNVKEVFEMDTQQTNVVDGQMTVLVRGKPLPLFYLSRWLVNPYGQQSPNEGHVVVMHVGNRMVAFVVDHLIGQEEVVIKPLGALLSGTRGLAGATITGDGSIALILDVPELIDRYSRAA